MTVSFDLPDLIAFRAAVELANFRKAAEAVHILQPAFSRRAKSCASRSSMPVPTRCCRRWRTARPTSA